MAKAKAAKVSMIRLTHKSLGNNEHRKLRQGRDCPHSLQRSNINSLNGSQWEGLALQHSRDEGQREGNDVDCQLELQELSNVFIHTSSPQDGLDDRVKVVIQDDDICASRSAFTYPSRIPVSK